MAFLAIFIAFFAALVLGSIFMSALGDIALVILAYAVAALALAGMVSLWEKLDRIEVKLERLLQEKEGPPPAPSGENREQ